MILLFLIMNFLSSRQLHKHTRLTRECTTKRNNSDPFPPTCTYFKDQKIMSHKVSGTSAISHQGNWAPQHNHSFQEESLILSTKSVAGLASAHEGNGQVARILFEWIQGSNFWESPMSHNNTDPVVKRWWWWQCTNIGSTNRKQYVQPFFHDNLSLSGYIVIKELNQDPELFNFIEWAMKAFSI